MPHPIVMDVGHWGYPTDSSITYFKCRLHGIVVAMMRLEIRNKNYEMVSNRRYCLQCFDHLLQQHLDPLVEASPEDVQQWLMEGFS